MSDITMSPEKYIELLQTENAELRRLIKWMYNAEIREQKTARKKRRWSK